MRVNAGEFSADILILPVVKANEKQFTASSISRSFSRSLFYLVPLLNGVDTAAFGVRERDQYAILYTCTGA